MTLDKLSFKVNGSQLVYATNFVGVVMQGISSAVPFLESTFVAISWDLLFNVYKVFSSVITKIL